MTRSKLGWLVLAAVLAIGGCVVEDRETPETPETPEPPEPPEPVARTQALGGITLPPWIPQVCSSQPDCSLEYLGGYWTALQQQLGCGQTYQYLTGGDGFGGGKASFCPDTQATRAILRDAGYRIYERGYCNECLHVPGNQIFVFWVWMIPPVCPSSCAAGRPPTVP